MTRFSWLLAGLLVVGAAAGPAVADVTVIVPESAKLELDGKPVTATGTSRKLDLPKLKAGEVKQYTLKVSYTKDGQPVTLTKVLTVEGGVGSTLDLTPILGVDPKKEMPKKEEPKKVEPKKEEPKKVEPKKEEPKKVEPKKEMPKKVEPKKEEPKKVEPKKEPKKEEPKKVEPKPEVKKEPKLDVPYVATPDKVVEAMLKLANVTDKDVVYDLGCGDGRIVVAAVKTFKAKKSVGIDLSPERVKTAKENAAKAGVAGTVEIREGDVLKLTDLSDASVVTLYLLPDVNEKLKAVLRKTLKPGARVVSHDFDMGADWKADKEVTVKDDTGREHTVYLWTIKEPAKKEEPKKAEPKPEVKKEEPKKAEPKKAEPKKEAPAKK